MAETNKNADALSCRDVDVPDRPSSAAGAVSPSWCRRRIPSWCSSKCRHRAWEARRAERESLPQVRVVTRLVEVEKTVRQTVEVPVHRAAHQEEWATLLETFATLLAQGRIYRRDLATVEPAVRRVVEVWNRTLHQPR